MKNYRLRLAARALIVQAEKLLLVSNDGHFWYTPGGGIEANETLPECAIREVKEETGISIQVNDVSYVYDFFDSKNLLHKVEIYLQPKSTLILSLKIGQTKMAMSNMLSFFRLRS